MTSSTGYVVREPVDVGPAVRLRRRETTIDAADGVRLALLHKEPVENNNASAPVVLVHGLRGTRHNWTLSSRSYQPYLVQQGHSTLCPELRGGGRTREAGSPLPRSVRELVEVDLARVISDEAERVGAPLVLIGHSLGGILSCLAASRWPEIVKAVVALGSPLRPGIDQPLMRFGCQMWVGLGRSAGLRSATSGESAASFLASGRRIMDRLSLPGRVADVYPGSLEPELETEHVQLVSSEPPPPELIRDLARLVLGMSPEGLDIDEELRRMNTPFLCIAGDRDELAPPNAVRPLFDAVGSDLKQWVIAGDEEHHLGHFDLVLGRRAPKMVWPVVDDWLKQVS